MTRVTIRLADLLRSYTGGAALVAARGATLGAVLDDLDRQFPGIRFRIVDEQDRMRRHMRCFIGDADARNLATPVTDGAEIYIVGALSGG